MSDAREESGVVSGVVKSTVLLLLLLLLLLLNLVWSRMQPEAMATMTI